MTNYYCSRCQKSFTRDTARCPSCLRTSTVSLEQTTGDQKSRPNPTLAPSLWTFNTVGFTLHNRRDEKSDGSVVMTHSFCILFLPIFPISAYRVLPHSEKDAYFFVSREPLAEADWWLRFLGPMGLVCIVLVTVAWLSLSQRCAS